MTIPAIVTPTRAENVYRVAFSVSEDLQRWSQIVCYAFPRDGKLEIAYSHHVHHSRSNESGPWTEYSSVRLPLTPIVEALIRSNVSIAIADHFIGKVRQITPELEAEIANAN